MADLFTVPKRRSRVSVTLTDAKPETTSSFGSDTRRICVVCRASLSSYLCPKCSIPFCGVDCYKKHGIKCTESFYQRQVCKVLDSEDRLEAPFISTLRSRVTQPSGINVPVEQSSDIDEETDAKNMGESGSCLVGISSERLEYLSSLPDIDSAHLTEDERKHFLRAAASGGLSSFIDTWIPWWRADCSTTTIEEVGDGHVVESDPPFQRLRARLKELPDFSTISASPASPLMPYLVTDILFSYCRVLRAFNGNWTVDPPSAASQLLSGSPVLHSDARHESMNDVVEKGLSAALSSQPIAGAGPLFELSFFEDVLCILKDRESVACVIAETRDILLSARQKKISKKLYFFLLWSYGAGVHNFKEAADELLLAWQTSLERTEKNRRGTTANGVSREEAPTNYRISSSRSRPLVQEIPSSENGKL